MWLLISIVGVLVLFLIWILWARMVVCINSYHNLYYLSFGGLVRVEPFEVDNQIMVRVRMPLFGFTIDPFRSKKSSHETRKKKTKRKVETGGSMQISFYLKRVREVVKTFSFRHLMVDIDTGDFVMNAKLTPILVGLNQFGGQFQVNYRGDVNLWIEFENRLVRFLPIAFNIVKEKYFKT